MFRRRHRSASFAAAWPSAREIAAKLKGETRTDGSGNFACHCPGPMHKTATPIPRSASRTARTAGRFSSATPAAIPGHRRRA